jgi:hypothetical protein
MRNILDRISLRYTLAALLYVLPASAAPPDAGNAARTRKILDLIVEIKVAEDDGLRDDKAVSLMRYIGETKESGHSAAFTARVVQGLGDLLDQPHDRLEITLAIGQVGPRAASLVPKLNKILIDESEKEKDSVVAQPIDVIDGACVALKGIGAAEPKTCFERDAK